MVKHWAYVPEYYPSYQICSDGTIKSLKRQVKLKDGTLRWVSERFLKPKNNGSGYQFVTLSKDGQTKSFYVHRLVACAYVENPDNLPYVNHKDGNPANNHAENLEWVTHKQNCQHAYDTGLNTNKGASHGFAVGVIDNEMGMKFDTLKEWAKARGINYNTCRNVLSGYTKSKTIEKTKIIKISKEINGETKHTK